jgi:non-homologous end joining protein Ku
MTRKLDLTEFKDDYRIQVQQLIEAKKKGKKTVETADDHDDQNIPPTINLMEALKKSLNQGKSSRSNGTRPHRMRKSA